MKTTGKKSVFRNRSGINADKNILRRLTVNDEEENLAVEKAILELKQESFILSLPFEKYKEAFEKKLRKHTQSLTELNSRLNAHPRATSTNYEMMFEQVEQKIRKMKIRLSEYKSTEKIKWEMFVRAFGFELEQTGKTIDEMIKMKL